jgi:hypothetical protein
MNLIPEYITGTVATSYSVDNQRLLLLGWAGRFKAFCADLPQITGAAIAAGSPNIFTAGGLQLSRCESNQLVQWAAMVAQPIIQHFALLYAFAHEILLSLRPFCPCRHGQPR